MSQKSLSLAQRVVALTLVLGCSSAPAAPPDQQPTWATTRTIPAEEAHQAAAADEKFLYAISSTKVAKYDRQTGQRLATSTGEAKHLNSGFLWQDKLYCSHSNYPALPEQSEIKVLDIETMQLTTFKDFGNFGGSLTWAIHEQGHWFCNFARYGDDNAGTFLVKFTPDWQEVARFTFPPELIQKLGRYSLSGGVFLNGDLLATGHDDPLLFRLRLPATGSIVQFIQVESIPFTGQGIAADPATRGLIGIHRAKRQLILATTASQRVTDEQQRHWRAQIRTNLSVPDPLPALETETDSQFEPTEGVIAERLSYRTQFGLRVPAILYRPKSHTGKLPGLIVVNGHGGDKFSWYAFYSGIAYARAGAAVLTYDPIGEGERNSDKKSGTRAHDKVLMPDELGRRMGGLMVTDVMQAVSLLRSRPEVDGTRIGAMGYSMGSFILSVAGAVDERLNACVLVGGGNLDGPGEYWDKSKPMCQALPYKALSFLGDRPAAIYALHASRGPTLIFNGLADTVVAIPTHGDAFFHDLRRRTTALASNPDRVFDYRLIPDVSHRPFFVTRDVALWLEEKLDFPKWTTADIEQMPTTRIADWATKNNVAMDRLYVTEQREGGTQAIGSNVPGLTRDELSVLRLDQWQARRAEFIYESWVAKARAALETPAAN
jgi:dienelactone hydrolase